MIPTLFRPALTPDPTVPVVQPVPARTCGSEICARMIRPLASYPREPLRPGASFWGPAVLQAEAGADPRREEPEDWAFGLILPGALTAMLMLTMLRFLT